MPHVKELVRISVLLLVLVSGTLLGMSLASWRLTGIAVAGALAGYVFTDWFRWFRIEGVVANLASIAILILAANDFLPGDSTGKLVSVANLLVYLQTILMFQEKTPRLIWQILVLSLLQVVVAAIFSLDFEGGLLFLLYFVIAGMTMFFQVIYAGNLETIRSNRWAALRLAALGPESRLELQDPSGATTSSPAQKPPKVSAAVALVHAGKRDARWRGCDQDPILFFDPPAKGFWTLRQMMTHLMGWMAVTVVFTLVMFYRVPRHTKPWFGPNKVTVSTAGLSKSVDLQNFEKIELSNALIFRATFETYEKGDRITAGDAPYFRGMALSSLTIENGRTNWRAPFDRVHNEIYQELPLFQKTGVPVKQTITLEETSDPLIYATMPVYRVRETFADMEFCHEISALTRCRFEEKIDVSPFKYELGTYVDNIGRFSKAWPYVSNTHRFRQWPMERDLPQYQWLTAMEKERYPRLVTQADEIAKSLREQNPDASRIDLVRKFEQYFRNSDRYQYTLDFRDARWSSNLDPVEDFFQNIRRGHCELYASALTLMLRSQGIPARLVVGFYGGDYQSLNHSYMVRAKHAHAWVEVYLRPEDCSQEMEAKGESGPGGAWLLADATPATTDSGQDGGTGAIDLARSMWQDYVLGMDENNDESSAGVIPFYDWLQYIDVDKMEVRTARFHAFRQSVWFRLGLPCLLLLLLIFFRVGAAMKAQTGKSKRKNSVPETLRKWVAGAISLISPSLGKWVLEAGSENRPTEFYDRMSVILETQGLVRNNRQTHREFAQQIVSAYRDHPASGLIASTVREITEIFNEVRFGHRTLETELKEQIDLSLEELEQTLQPVNA